MCISTYLHMKYNVLNTIVNQVYCFYIHFHIYHCIKGCLVMFCKIVLRIPPAFQAVGMGKQSFSGISIDNLTCSWATSANLFLSSRHIFAASKRQVSTYVQSYINNFLRNFSLPSPYSVENQEIISIFFCKKKPCFHEISLKI